MLAPTIFDLLLPLAYLTVFYALSRWLSRHFIRRDQQFFRWGFVAKMLGSAAFMAVYLLHFREGDTFFYYQGADKLWELLVTRPVDGLTLLTLSDGQHNLAFAEVTQSIKYFEAPAEWSFTRIAGLVNLFCFNNFFCLSFCFGYVAFLGTWALFRVFSNNYPAAKTSLFVAIFLIPSALLWTSGLLKDTLCMGMIGFVFQAAYRLLDGRRVWRQVAILALGFSVLAIIKPYLAYSFLIAVLPWAYLKLLHRPMKVVLKRSLHLLAVSVLLLLTVNLFGIIQTLEEGNSFQLAMARIQGYHHEFEINRDKDDSRYSLGAIDYSVSGLLEKAPAAMVTTLVRPFLWEPGKLLVKLMSLENLIYFLALVGVVVQREFWRAPWRLLQNEDVLFCLLFVLSLSLVVGITAYNYGLLMRLKAPLLPFLGAGLVIVFQQIHRERSPALATSAAM
ncbi:MAG: hypothetical protein AAGB22_03385 [Bacteroidota bacterium]